MRRSMTASFTSLVSLLRVLYAAAFVLTASSAAAQPAVSGGGGHSLMLKADGTVWAAGQNVWGQLGNNSQTTSGLPVQVIGLTNVTAIAAGGTHSMALTASGTVYVWGWNASSQLGDASTNYVETTPKLLSLTNVAAIAAGDYHSIALTTSGDLYTWGGNGVGQLGNGSNTTTSVPQLVASGVQAIAAGIQVTLFVKTDGTVWGTGDNEWGQLGDNTFTARNTPVQMIGVAGAVAVRGGNKHSVILLADGTVAAVGINGAGQAGFSGHWYRATAGPVDGLTNIVAISTGRDFSLALDGDGAVWSWGTNGYSGTLGTPTPPWRSTPAAIPGLTDITHIAAGNYHALAVDSTNTVYAWGDNANGEVGDGSFSMRNVPVAITGEDFDWRVGTPRLYLAPGTYFTDQAVTVTNATVGSSMHYTQNGNDPTEFDPTVSSGASISITSSQTLKVKAFKAGSPASAVASATYVLKVTPPTFSPGPNIYSSAQNIGITSSTPGVTIRYTLDGSEPTASSTFYSSLVLIQHTSTLKAIALKTGWTTSDVQSGSYTMNFGTLGAPTVTPATGTYGGSVTVSMTPSVSGATIRYRTDGGTPDSSSPVYTAPFSLTETATVRAKAYHPDYTESSETSRTYTITAATPTLSVASGSYAPGTVVTVATSEAAATLRMTLDGTDPTLSSPVIASGTGMMLGNYTFKVRAFRTGVNDSAG